MGVSLENRPIPRRPAVALAQGGRDNAEAMSTTTQPPKPKRRWYQFSLKTLLVVMTVAIVAFGGWVQYMRKRAQENRDRVAAVKEAVAWIDKVGGWIESEYIELRPQTWLEEQFGDPGEVDDPVDVVEVTVVDFTFYLDGNPDVTDVGLEHVTALKHIETLNLNFTNVTDAGMAHISGLIHLRYLGLNGTKVTSTGLKHLKGLIGLELLSLHGSNVTDVGLEHLKEMTKLVGQRHLGAVICRKLFGWR